MANIGIALGGFAEGLDRAKARRQKQAQIDLTKRRIEQQERNQLMEQVQTNVSQLTQKSQQLTEFAIKNASTLNQTEEGKKVLRDALTTAKAASEKAGQLAGKTGGAIQAPRYDAIVNMARQVVENTPTPEQAAAEKGRLSTIEEQAATEAGGGFETLTLPSGQLAQRDRVTGEIDTVGSAPDRVFASIDGVTGVFTEQELAEATQQGREVSRAPSVSNNQKAVVDAQSNQIVFATDEEIAQNRERFRPLQEGDIISRLELAARSAGIDPEKIKRGNLDNLTQDEAKAVAAELVKSDPLLSVLFGGSESGQSSLEEELKELEE